MNYFDTLDKTLCCGCTACASVCPVTCIAMEEDSSGFLYPKVDKDKCINCGLCKKVCPLADDHSSLLAYIPQKDCYAFTTNNQNTLDASTSGGAFTTIVDGFCKNSDYVIYGVKYNDDLTLEYSYIKNVDQMPIFGKSKYFQSEMKNSYKEIKNFLEEGKKVVFSGTPCHVAGLKGFLRKEYDGLLCVDVLCFGVPSKKAFLSYKQYSEKRYKDKLISYQFRKKGSSEVVATFENIGEVKTKSYYDYYMRAFYARKMHRDCCTQCQFKREERQGDITIGDFCGIYNTTKKFDLDKGVSLVIFNTGKGKTLIDNFADSGLFDKYDISCAVNHNQLKPSKWAVEKEVYSLIEKDVDFDKAIKKVLPLTIKQRVKKLVLSVMPKGLKNSIKKIMAK
jgi:coenzyme F420-reducing hydrogenase beta subunit